jgi:hypothetical protein
LDDFKKLDYELIEKLGRGEVGKSKWRSLSSDEKYLVAYEAVSSSMFQESFEETNFGLFLRDFNRHIGGNNAQLCIIDKQLTVKIKSILSFDTRIADELKKIDDMHKALSRERKSYDVFFWEAYCEGSRRCKEDYQLHMDHTRLQEAMLQLIRYHHFVEDNNDTQADRPKILEEMASLVRLQISVFLQHAKSMAEWTKVGGFLDTCFEWKDACYWRRILCNERCAGPSCREECHYMLHPDVETINEAEWVWGCHNTGYNHNGRTCWKNTSTGNMVNGIKHSDGKKVPRNYSQHWVRNGPNQWQNVYTNAIANGKCNPVSGESIWASLTPHDSFMISYSILLLSNRKSFAEYFGRDKMQLERAASDYVSVMQRLDADALLGTLNSPRLAMARELLSTNIGSGVSAATYPENSKQLPATIPLPQQLSDPEHWGHLMWQFCNFMDAKHGDSIVLRTVTPVAEQVQEHQTIVLESDSLASRTTSAKEPASTKPSCDVP